MVKAKHKKRSDKSNSRFISISEFTRRLGVCRMTVYRNMPRYRESGLVEIRLGKRTMIDATSIEPMLAQMKQVSQN